MTYQVVPHESIPSQYYVNGQLIAGAKDEDDAVRIYEEAQNNSGP